MEFESENTSFYEEMQLLRQENCASVEVKFDPLHTNDNSRFFRIHSLTYEKDFPRLEAFENVVASINKPHCRLAYYLRGTQAGAELYMGIIADPGKGDNLNSVDYETMLDKAFKGNFLGSKLEECASISGALQDPRLYYSTVLGIPSRNKEKENISFQGVDRLINIMSDVEYHLLIVWEPMPQQSIEVFDSSVKEIYGFLQRIAKQSIQSSKQQSEQDSFGEQKGTGTNRGTNKGTNSSTSDNKGWSTCEGESSGGKSHSKGTNESINEGSSTNESRTTSKSTTSGSSLSVTWEEQNKVVTEYLKYIDDELLPRLRQGRAKGMYSTAIYLAAENNANLSLLENAVTSIYQGDNSTFFPLHVQALPRTDATRRLVSSFSIYNRLDAQSSLLPLCSRPIGQHKVSLATCLTPAEISIVAGLPQKEVPGLELREQVTFGLNINIPEKHDEQLHLGHMVQEGTLLEHRSAVLSRQDMDKHIFIAGTTGSGKTTTCHRLLHDAKMPFLVIEPAKTEYRVLLNDPAFSDILLFTVGNEKGVPFRFNPFEFLQEESLSAHVDQLKACFMASFDMEAAIPNLLEEGLYKVYEAFGWSFRDDSNRFLEDRADAWRSNGSFFPTIGDYINTLVKLIPQKGFGDRLRDEYIGSVRARLDSLCAGVKGLMLNTRSSVDFTTLLDRKVILELEELKSGEDKSFVMGLVLARLSEALKARHKIDPQFRHITLVEEAHRLLKRPMPGDSPNRMMGVEMFSDMLAEIRKYGESLIIVDQIPSKLAPEVLKNTNTKIIHKLFSKDDKETVGDTMALDEKQRDFLSNLLTGEAVVFSQGWKKPVHVMVERLPDVQTAFDIDEKRAFEQGWHYWLQHPWLYCPACPKELAGKLTAKKLTAIEHLSADLCNLFSKDGTCSTEDTNAHALFLHIQKALQDTVGDAWNTIFSNTISGFFKASCIPRLSPGVQGLEDFQKAEENIKKTALEWSATFSSTLGGLFKTNCSPCLSPGVQNLAEYQEVVEDIKKTALECSQATKDTVKDAFTSVSKLK